MRRRRENDQCINIKSEWEQSQGRELKNKTVRDKQNTAFARRRRRRERGRERERERVCVRQIETERRKERKRGEGGRMKEMKEGKLNKINDICELLHRNTANLWQWHTCLPCWFVQTRALYKATLLPPIQEPSSPVSTNSVSLLLMWQMLKSPWKELETKLVLMVRI